jgi:hypothetical protein
MNRNKRSSPLYLLTGAVLVFTSFILYHSCKSSVSERKPTAGIAEKSKPVKSYAPRQRMATGLERPMYADLPYLGRVSGARWLPNVKFPALKDNDRTDGDRPLDVLVDADGMFITARNGGNRFDTQMNKQNMLIMMQTLMNPRNRPPGAQRPVFTSAITSIRPAKYRPDNPVFSNAVRNLLAEFPPGYYHTYTPQHGEETYCILEVNFEGEAASRLIAIQRVTEGTASYGGPPYQPDPVEGIRTGGPTWNNRNGCSVGYRCFLWTPDGEQAWAGPALSTRISEAWVGDCPWPDDQVAEPFSNNKLNELTVPDIINVHEVRVPSDSMHFTWEPWLKSQRARAEKAYQERIAREGR